jgi:serine protease Do
MYRQLIASLLLLPAILSAQDINDATERAMKDAAAKVAPSIARIETSGGQEAVWGVRDPRKGSEVLFRRGTGSTTGLVVDPAGYVITSSFNFIGKPTDIFVTVPGKQRTVAKVVGTDSTRMLTLLKIDQTGLPVPTPFPKKNVEVGQWSIAMGRTLNPNLDQSPSIHGGIVSAINRVWGKVIQSDAKISPVNYGGPLCSIDGRVMGVIVPISPTSEAETAGFEWYDVGIGFAVPFEDVLQILPKLKAGTPEKPVTLRGGLMGITFKEADQYTPTCTIDTIAPNTPAASVGLKRGDRIVEVEGKPVTSQTQLLHIVRPKYEGDIISLKVKRDDKEMEFKEIKLGGSQMSQESGFLGILPMRDDPELGVEIRYVYEKSPADTAGLKVGDRIMKVGIRPQGGAPKQPKIDPKAPMVPNPQEPRPFAGRDQFQQIMQNFPVGVSLNLEVKRKEGKTETIEVVLGQAPDAIPKVDPDKSTKKQAMVPPKSVEPIAPKKEAPKKEEAKKEEPKKEEPKKKEDEKEAAVGYQKITGQGGSGRDFWIYVPETYDKNISYGMVVWLHPAGRDGRDSDDMIKIWERICDTFNLILVGPISGTNTGWVAGEAEGIMADIRWVRTRYTIDPQRVIAHGLGVGGQMAYYMAINHREVIRAAIPVGAVLASNPKEPTRQRLAFLVIGGARDPIVKDIVEGYKKLSEKKYTAIYREMKNSGKEYVNDDGDVFVEMIRWIDTLDRQ